MCALFTNLHTGLHSVLAALPLLNLSIVCPLCPDIVLACAYNAGSMFTKTGVNDIAIARGDGSLEIYDLVPTTQGVTSQRLV